MTNQLKLKKLSMAVCLTLFSSASFAATFGVLNVHSNLGELLKAEMAILVTTPAEIATFNASIANQSIFSENGAEYLDIHKNIHTKIVKNSDSTYSLILTSDKPISSHFKIGLQVLNLRIKLIFILVLVG